MSLTIPIAWRDPVTAFAPFAGEPGPRGPYCGAIVAESDPEAEHAEMMAKVVPALAAIEGQVT